VGVLVNSNTLTFNGGLSNSQTASLTGAGTVAASGTFSSLPVVTLETGLGDTYANVGVSYSATITSGNAVWNSSSGSTWGGSNWQDAGNAAVHVAPGQFATFANSDTAAFSGSGSVTAIDLSTAIPMPSLKALSFSNSNYTLTGGNLTLSSSTGTAGVTVTSGAQEIDSVLTLSSSTSIAPADGAELTLGGNVGGSGALELAASGPLGTGMLILSGTDNTYSGGTYVNTGTLIVNNSGAIQDGTSLTVGAGGTFIFDPTMSGTSMDASPSLRPEVVPEPGTIGLLLAALWSAAIYCRFGRPRTGI
jgi:autotransporter-associated beta strand protein